MKLSVLVCLLLPAFRLLISLLMNWNLLESVRLGVVLFYYIILFLFFPVSDYMSVQLDNLAAIKFVLNIYFIQNSHV